MSYPLRKVNPMPIELNKNDDIPLPSLSHITNVMVGEYHHIAGDAGPSYLVWTIKVILNNSLHSSLLIYKRYSELLSFRDDLINHFHEYSSDIPPLPPKDSINFGRFMLSDTWLENRRKGIQWFLSNILLNPKFQNTDIVKKFILQT